MKRIFLICSISMLVFSSCVVRTDKQGTVRSLPFFDLFSSSSVDETRIEVIKKVRDFDKFELHGPFDVVYKQGNYYSLVIRGGKDYVENVKLQVKNGKLIISQRKNLRTKKSSNVTIQITSPDIIFLAKSGVGNFTANGLVDTDTLAVKVTGVGDINFEKLKCDYLDVKHKGVGDVELSDVMTSKAIVVSSGVGDVRMNLTNTSYMNILHSGVGSMQVHFNNCGLVDCLVKGVGNVKLSGTLRDCKKMMKGIGSLDVSELKIMGRK